MTLSLKTYGSLRPLLHPPVCKSTSADVRLAALPRIDSIGHAPEKLAARDIDAQAPVQLKQRESRLLAGRILVLDGAPVYQAVPGTHHPDSRMHAGSMTPKTVRSDGQVA